MNAEKSTWHNEILPPASAEVLDDLNTTLLLSHFYLAGGTGLAFMLGHRLSRDFDFFSPDLFNAEVLIQKMQGLSELTIVAKSEHMLHLLMKEIKVSFLGYNYPLLFPTKIYQTGTGSAIEVADERDIACMKISAIGSRGTKRDFVDLYMVAQIFNLSDLFTLFKRKFSLTPYNNVHILKSLTYFINAELEPMPHMLVPLAWDTVKQFFTSEIPKL